MPRLEPAVQYKRLIKRTLVSALRSVFSDDYPDPQLKNLYVSTTFPIKREEFPAVIVEYKESSVQNAGVAHIEEIYDANFNTVPLKHFRFEGSINFTCYALSPLDVDILSDSVMELLAFGRLDNLMNRFFERVFEEVDDSAQISIHSDYLSPLGESTQATQWNSEDMLIYQSGYSVSCSGGFYSTLKEEDIKNYVEDIVVYGSLAYSEEEEKLLELFGNNSLNPYYVRGRGIVSSA